MMNNKIYRYPQQQQMKGGDSASRSAPPLQQQGGRGLLSNPGQFQKLGPARIQPMAQAMPKPQVPMQQAVGNPEQMNQWNSLPQSEQQKYFNAGGAPDFARPPQTGGPVYNQPQMSNPTIGNGQQMGNNMNMSAGQPAAMPRQDRDPNQVAARQAQRQAYLQRMGRA